MKVFISILCMSFFFACEHRNKKEDSYPALSPDPHSFSFPSKARTTHLNLDIECNFEKKQIIGTALYDIQQNASDEIVLDMMNLKIDDVWIIDENAVEKKAEFQLGETDPILGTPLKIKINSTTKKIKINYKTGEDAIALQWLSAGQTNTKEKPYLLTQSQSIYARSWIPCQDGPGVRFSYHATVKVPEGLMAVMSATNPRILSPDGHYEFDMEIPIPAYLLALAVGDFSFRPLGNRTGVYADSLTLNQAVWEFEDLEKMVEQAEALYGQYPWGRYDVIVLPSSFPFGGMENPRLTFLTPTVIAGDRSLTSLLAHELAHSWSGNLVTNATWEDFWLNEGFTTYFENRIMEALYGKSYADMLSLLGYQDLLQTMHQMGDSNELTKLKLQLRGKDPEEALTDIAYEKGKTLLRYLEERIGRKEWDGFLRSYFERYKFQSGTSEMFVDFLQYYFKPFSPGILDTVNSWIYKPGLIPYHPNYNNSRFENIDSQLRVFTAHPDVHTLQTQNWSSHEWVYFLRHLRVDTTGTTRKSLDKEFHLSKSGNAEISFCWLNYLIDCGASKEDLSLIENFLNRVGRRKFVAPLFESLINHGKTSEAKAIYEKVKTSYHPITRHSIDQILYPKI